MNKFLKVGTKQAIFEIRRNNQTICLPSMYCMHSS